MTRTKKIYLLLAVLVVLSIAAFAFSQVEEDKEQISNSGETILEIDSDKVTSLSWNYGSEELSFHKDGSWLYDEDKTFPVNEKKVADLLETFQDFKAAFTIEDVKDYGQYGLDDPECSISLQAAGKSYEVLLGDYSTMDSERYVSIGDGNAYLAETDPMEKFEITLDDMMQNDKTPSLDKAKSISFSGTSDLNIAYEEDSENAACEEDVYFMEQDGKQLPLDTEAVDDYLSAISNLELTEYMTYDATQDDLKTYKLDSPELSVHLDYVPNEEDNSDQTDSFDLYIGCDKGDSDDDDDDTAYVRVGKSKIIYKISSGSYEELADASYNHFRHKEVVVADRDAISSIDVSLDGKSYTITTKKKGNKVTCYYKGKKIKTDFLNAVKKLEADSFTNKEPTQKEEISFTVHLDKKGDSSSEVHIYRYDGTNCLVTIDGKPVSLVKRDSVVDLIETVNAIVLD